jgi:hypothetical protein
MFKNRYLLLLPLLALRESLYNRSENTAPLRCVGELVPVV